ncbi:MAG: Rieske 2Fe-2S domain-containing protein [Planctomycetes bacterium]|nr:Rieske 2Fe-2S domain-containing protein [Planctomycetota bacterium]
MILILSHDCPASLLDDVVRECERQGWRCTVSRGTEQTLVTLEGSGDPEQLDAAFRDRPEVDVLPILSQREYRYLRGRRRLLAGLAGGLGALTALGAGLPIAGFLMPPKGAVSDRNLVRVAGREEVKERSGKKVTLLGKPVILVRMERDRWFALSAICTHMNICQLDWHEERRELVCPCHGGAFDVYGNVVQGPPSIPLATYPVERVGDELFVRREG